MLSSVEPPKFESTKIENWPHNDLDALIYYTNALKRLGFIELGDYTATAPNFQGILRLFSHNEYSCFAEVVQIVGSQIFCSFSSSLESDWTIAIINHETTSTGCASSYIRARRLPRKIIRWFPKSTPEILLATFLEWRSQVMQDLLVQQSKDISVEMYFARTRKWFLEI